MLSSNIDINQNYFYMPFGPKFDIELKEYGIVCTTAGEYYQEKTGTKWARRLLYNTGWGQPYGYERLPSLSFESLMELALKSDPRKTKLKIIEEESNKYGAVAIIMERHIPELINYLYLNLNNRELFCNGISRKNLKLFCFDASKAESSGGVGKKSYEEMLSQHESWHQISSRVKALVYQ